MPLTRSPEQRASRHEAWGAAGTERGVLYVVATPIGNLEDITLRALRILKEVDIIAAEHVTHTRNLCRAYGIDTSVTAYHQHNRKQKAPRLLQALREGRRVALVSDAGTPGISDPGAYLVGLAAEEGIAVTPIPGPSAVIAALCVAGLDTSTFHFMGFLSHRPARRRKELREMAGHKGPLVLFESPHRLKATLEDIREVLADPPMVLAREVTKLYEEVRRGKTSRLLKDMDLEAIKGECTLIVVPEGTSEQTKVLGPRIERRMEELLAQGGSSGRDVAQKVSEEFGIPFREAYKVLLSKKRAKRR